MGIAYFILSFSLFFSCFLPTSCVNSPSPSCQAVTIQIQILHSFSFCVYKRTDLQSGIYKVHQALYRSVLLQHLSTWCSSEPPENSYQHLEQISNFPTLQEHSQFCGTLLLPRRLMTNLVTEIVLQAIDIFFVKIYIYYIYIKILRCTSSWAPYYPQHVSGALYL